MDPDVAQATQRIFSALVWTFAVVVAYPYIPGSSTQAFKGVSVFFGLIISLGSTGIINQIMSGLFVVYSKALKRGEWVRVNETEGEVLEVGLLAAKVRNIEGQEVTIPNSVLVGTLTRNYSRLGCLDGMIASTTLTIGYDAPWRQVHALLLLAAGRTDNIRSQPEPYVLQRQLSDFYVEYMLVVRLADEKKRIDTLSTLHSSIQDAFNEYGVQIMSPHFVIQPERNIGVPPSHWHRPPSAPVDSANGISAKAEPV
jgi:small-conductance mechanosensitive channel